MSMVSDPSYHVGEMPDRGEQPLLQSSSMSTSEQVWWDVFCAKGMWWSAGTDPKCGYVDIV